MQALLIARHDRSLLYPLAETTPIPLLPLTNRPLIEFTLEMLARAGIKRVTVALHSEDAMISKHCGGGERWGMSLTYGRLYWSGEAEGKLTTAIAHINETCLILPLDALLDLEIEEVMAFHRAHAAPATAIMASRAAAPGTMREGEDNQRLEPTGAWVVEPEALHDLVAWDSRDITASPATEPSDHTYVMHGYWNPLESLRDYQEAQLVYLHSAWRASQGEQPRIRQPQIDGTQIASGIWVGRYSIIAHNTSLTPPLCIGENCRIGPGVELGSDTLIGHNVVIDRDATVASSTVMNDTYIGRLVKLERRIIRGGILIDPDDGAHVRVADTFLLADVRSLRQRLRLRRRWRELRARITWFLRRMLPNGREAYEQSDHLRRA